MTVTGGGEVRLPGTEIFSPLEWPPVGQTRHNCRSPESLQRQSLKRRAALVRRSAALSVPTSATDAGQKLKSNNVTAKIGNLTHTIRRLVLTTARAATAESARGIPRHPRTIFGKNLNLTGGVA